MQELITSSAIEPDDESTNRNFSGHLSAIHALMAISEPTGYRQMTSRKIDSAIEDNLQLEKANVRGRPIKIEKQVAITEAPRDVSDRSSPIISSIKFDEQLQERFLMQDYKGDEVYDPYSIFKSLDTLPDFGLTKYRKCRYENCEDEVALVPIDDKVLNREVVMEDMMYNTTGFCRKHLLGTKKCEHEGCDKCAQGSTKFCIKHGGGRRCTIEGCNKGARDKHFCAGHGGGKRCSVTLCDKSAVGGSGHCCVHGGGKKCTFDGCHKSAQSPTQFCVKHGGGKTCLAEGCIKVSRGTTSYCAGHGGGTRCKLAECQKAAMSSNDVCRLHAEYSTFASKPKKVKANKKSLVHAGLTANRAEDNGYDTIHGNSYYVTPLPTDDLYLVGGDQDLYFNDDEYTNSDDNNNNNNINTSNTNTNNSNIINSLGNGDSIIESIPNQGPGYSIRQSDTTLPSGSLPLIGSAIGIGIGTGIGTGIGIGIESNRLYQTAFTYPSSFNPYQHGRHPMFCQPSKMSQRVNSSKMDCKVASSVMQGDDYGSRTGNHLDNFEDGYSLHADLLEVKKGSAVYHTSNDSIRNNILSANCSSSNYSSNSNSSSSDSSSANSGLTSRDGANRSQEAAPSEAPGMRQSGSLNDVLQALGRIGEPQYFDSSRDRDMGRGSWVAQQGADTEYAPYRQVKGTVYESTGVQHSVSHGGSQGQGQGQGYTHERAGYPQRAYMPVLLSPSVPAPYLLQGGSAFNASRRMNSNSNSNTEKHHMMNERTHSDRTVHSDSNGDLTSHRQQQQQFQVDHCHHRNDFLTRDVMSSYQDHPVLCSSHSYPTAGQLSSLFSNIAGVGNNNVNHTMPQPPSHHVILSARESTQGSNIEYDTHTSKHNTLADRACYISNADTNTDTSTNINSNTSTNINSNLDRDRDRVLRNSVDAIAHTKCFNESNFPFVSTTNRSTGSAQDFQSHTRTHTQVHTGTHIQTQLHTRGQRERDEDPSAPAGPQIPALDTYSSRSVQSLLSRLSQNTQPTARGGQRDDYPEQTPPTQLTQVIDRTVRDSTATHAEDPGRPIFVHDPHIDGGESDRNQEGTVGVRVAGRKEGSSEHEDIDIMDSSFAADILLAYAAQKCGRVADIVASPQPTSAISTQNFLLQFNADQRSHDLDNMTGRGESDTLKNFILSSKNNQNNGNSVNYTSIGHTVASNLSNTHVTASANTSRKRGRGGKEGLDLGSTDPWTEN